MAELFITATIQHLIRVRILIKNKPCHTTKVGQCSLVSLVEDRLALVVIWFKV